jgi:hypothetical protein
MQHNRIFGNAVPCLVYLLLLAAFLVAGCAKNPPLEPLDMEDDTPVLSDGAASPLAETLSRTNPNPRVTVKWNGPRLGTCMRDLRIAYGGSFVVMNGMEAQLMPEFKARRKPLRTVLKSLALVAEAEVQETQEYAFFYPKGYESLAGVTLEGRLPTVFDEKRITVSFGSPMKLFRVLAILSRATGISMAADNIVADAQCGEVSLVRTPLRVVLEALLKSARISPERFAVDATQEYLFLRSANNLSANPTLLNPEVAAGDIQTALDKVVDVALPSPLADPAKYELPAGATPLKDVLSSLSNQTGIAVRCEPELEGLPVNPLFLNKVRVRTAMDLLIRQWMSPDLGYDVRNNELVIRRR